MRESDFDEEDEVDDVAAVLNLRASDDPLERFVGQLIDIESTPFLDYMRNTKGQQLSWGSAQDDQ